MITWPISLADVEAAFLDERTFPAAAAHREHTEPVLGRTMTTMTGHDHRRNRVGWWLAA